MVKINISSEPTDRSFSLYKCMPFNIIMITIILAISTFLLSWRMEIHWSNAGQPTVPAQLLTVRSPVFDCGYLGSQQHAIAKFRLTNQSESLIHIIHLYPSCWCVSAICRHKIIAPRSMTSIKVSFDDSEYIESGTSGTFAKSILVVYKLAHNPKLYSMDLIIRGELGIAVPFNVYPTRVAVAKISQGATATAVIYFRGQRALFQTLPKSIDLTPGTRIKVVLATKKQSSNLGDRSLAVIIKVPSDGKTGSFRSLIDFYSIGFGPVKVTFTGRIVVP